MKRDGAKINIIFAFCLIMTDILVMCDKQLYTVSQVNVINSPGQSAITALTLVGRDRALNGTITILEDLSDDFKLTVLLFSDPRGIGDFTLMPMEIRPMGICTALKDFYRRFIKGSIDTNIHTNFDFEDGDVCPLAKGTYWLKNVIFNTNHWVNILPRGLIKAELRILNNNKFVGGFSIVVNIENKVLL